MSRILGIRVIKPRRRLQNGTLQRVIFHRPGVIDPQREGKRGVVMHYNTAFALALGIDYARAVEDNALESAILEAATRFYHADTQYPAHYEPGGDEYVSGALTESTARA